jgi:alpha/beta superfamily hydrolase
MNPGSQAEILCLVSENVQKEIIRPSTVLPAKREVIRIRTADGLSLIGEVATPLESLTPITPIAGTLLTLHPLPTHGGMMDSHLLAKAANRLPAMAGIRVVRFNTRGTESALGKSEGEFGSGESERLDVEAAIEFVTKNFPDEPLWVLGWSFGTDLALRYARDSMVSGLILLSPPLRTTSEEDLHFWAKDGRDVIALIPEFDDYLPPKEARERFKVIPQLTFIPVEGAKHLWVGEPAVYRVLSEIVKVIKKDALPLPTEY